MKDAHLVLGVLNGDDIGHEIVPAAVEAASAAAKAHGLRIDWRPMPIGRRALDMHGSTMPAGTLETLAAMDGFVLGPIGHRDYPRVPGAINPHPIMRKHFNLFANVRPTRSFPDIGCLHDNVDLVIVRENNEGFQPDRNVVAGCGEFRPTEDVTISVRVRGAPGARAPAPVPKGPREEVGARGDRVRRAHQRRVELGLAPRPAASEDRACATAADAAAACRACRACRASEAPS